MPYKPGESGNPKGKPKGAGMRPHFRSYWTDEEIYEFIQHVKVQYRLDETVMKWVGDQLFGKALQSISGPNGQPLFITGVDDESRKRAELARAEVLDIPAIGPRPGE